MVEHKMSEIFMTLPTRISDVFSHWAEQTPDRPALVEAGCTWTYRELASVVAATASWLRESGVRPGDRVMIVCENCRAFVAILFALSQLDAWAVLVNARLSAGEVDKIRDHCGARRVIYTTSVSSHALAQASRRECQRASWSGRDRHQCVK
jgi:acyl-CoA synthetase (AMP-forming)/AMP-acid ligase II